MPEPNWSGSASWGETGIARLGMQMCAVLLRLPVTLLLHEALGGGELDGHWNKGEQIVEREKIRRKKRVKKEEMRYALAKQIRYEEGMCSCRCVGVGAVMGRHEWVGMSLRKGAE